MVVIRPTSFRGRSHEPPHGVSDDFYRQVERVEQLADAFEVVSGGRQGHDDAADFLLGEVARSIRHQLRLRLSRFFGRFRRRLSPDRFLARHFRLVCFCFQSVAVTNSSFERTL